MVVGTGAFYTPQTVSKQPIAEADQPGNSLHVKCIAVMVNRHTKICSSNGHERVPPRRGVNQWKVTWLEVWSCNPWLMTYRAFHRGSKIEESGCYSLRRIISSVVTTSDQVRTPKHNLYFVGAPKSVGTSTIARVDKFRSGRQTFSARVRPLHCVGRSHRLCPSNIPVTSRPRNPYSLWLSATTSMLDIRGVDGDRKMTTCDDTMTDSATGYLRSNENLQSYAGVHSNHIHALSDDAWAGCMV
ncbi:hypothetical protein EDC04DRAFT_2713152 [Pisolithus marmoratus]|nr:hypothetical protein EDC04DRAFT_2713152 [Pisolithus marmoratus]